MSDVAPPEKYLRILCVDDDPNMRRLLALFLNTAGHYVTTANSGNEALDTMQAGTNIFDLIIADHNMPVVNGIELINELRSRNYPGKIMVLSGALTRADCAAYEKLSVDKVLTKPIGRPALLTAIEMVFDS